MIIYKHKHVEQIQQLFATVEDSVYVRETVLRYLAAMEAGYREEHPAVSVILSNYSPRHASSAVSGSSFPVVTTEELREVMAHYFGFAAFAEIDAGATLDRSFEKAVDNLLGGDTTGLTELLEHDPKLISRQSDFGHRAGLIHYLAANGVEMHRQVVPANASEILYSLLERGADPQQSHQLYGGRGDLRSLIETSAHPAAAGVREALLRQLPE